MGHWDVTEATGCCCLRGKTTSLYTEIKTPIIAHLGKWVDRPKTRVSCVCKDKGRVFPNSRLWRCPLPWRRKETPPRQGGGSKKIRRKVKLPHANYRVGLFTPDSAAFAWSRRIPGGDVLEARSCAPTRRGNSVWCHLCRPFNIRRNAQEKHILVKCH